MGELHSMAFSSSGLHHSSCLGWDLKNLQVVNTDMSVYAVMEEASQLFSSPDSDFSTGYLEDALLEFSQRSKRRRLMLDGSYDHQSKSYWNSSCDWEMYENFSCMSDNNGFHGVSDELISMPMSNISEEEHVFPEMKSPDRETLDSSSTSSKDSAKTKSIFDKNGWFPMENMPQSDGNKRKNSLVPRVVYPFALVKPGGVEGDMTINDINERILMPPTRPVRHPVGDFACRPCVSADGLGLSGKAVVALTRIHTQGRGTITIIRTKD